VRRSPIGQLAATKIRQAVSSLLAAIVVGSAHADAAGVAVPDAGGVEVVVVSGLGEEHEIAMHASDDIASSRKDFRCSDFIRSTPEKLRPSCRDRSEQRSGSQTLLQGR
jgi:hypothetical protein